MTNSTWPRCRAKHNTTRVARLQGSTGSQRVVVPLVGSSHSCGSTAPLVHADNFHVVSDLQRQVGMFVNINTEYCFYGDSHDTWSIMTSYKVSAFGVGINGDFVGNIHLVDRSLRFFH